MSWRRWTAPSSPAPVWIALGLVVLGFALIIGGWSIVAGTVDTGDQIAALIGPGLGGLALVVIGVVALALAVERRDAAARARHLATLDVPPGAPQ